MKLGFTGTRRGLTTEQREACEDYIRRIGASELHHGDAIGADTEAHAIALQMSIRTVIHPPAVEVSRSFCKGDEVRAPASYSVRNQAIVDETEHLLGAPHCAENEAPGAGTWRTIRYAVRSGKRVTIIWPDGRCDGPS